MTDSIGPTATSAPAPQEGPRAVAVRLGPEAFASEYKAAFRPLWCVAAAVTGRRDLAEDVLQDAAAVALTKLGEFDPSTSFVAWMAQIVRYVALNRRRKETRAARHDGAAAPRSPTPPAHTGGRVIAGSGHLLPDQHAFDDTVVRLLGELDDDARACLLLRVVMDMPYRDISRILSIPEGTAMSHVHRSRAALRRRWHARGPKGEADR